MSPSQNSYVFAILLIKSLLKCFFMFYYEILQKDYEEDLIGSLT